MIARLLPACAASAEARADDPAAAPHPDEREAVAGAVQRRRREFVTGRACARAALERLGAVPVAIPAGPRGEPVWPAGIVGSITHCDGYRAAAVARTGDVAAIGIDAEPNRPLPGGLLDDVASATEREHLLRLARTAPGVAWDRLLFSAKEAVYKAWFPVTGAWLGFEDAEVEVDPDTGRFGVRLLRDAPEELAVLTGAWSVERGLIATAVVVVS